MGRARELEKAGRLLTRSETHELFLSITELEKEASIEIQMAYPPLLCPASRIRQFMCTSCNIPHVLGLLADGRVAMCGIGNTDERLIYASVRESSLEEIWRTKPHPILRDLRASFPEQLTGVCAKCLFKNQCRGSCRAVAFQQYGSVSAPWPQCQEAFDAGLVSPGRLVTSET